MISKAKSQLSFIEIILSTLAQSEVAAIVTDIHREIIYVNKPCLTMWGYDDISQLIGEPVKVLFANNDEEQHYYAMPNRIMELSCARRDGTKFFAQITRQIEHIQTKGPGFFVDIAFDITKRRSTELELQEANTRMELLLNAIPDVVVKLNKELIIEWANKAAIHVNPRSVGSLCYEAHCGRTKPCKGCHGLRAMKTRKICSSIIYHPAHQLGPTYWENIGVPIIDEIGEVTGVIEIGRNVTNRVKSEISLRDSEEFNTNLLNNSPNPIAVFNPDTSVKYVNPSLERLTRYRFDELVGKKAPYPWWPESPGWNARSDFRSVFQKSTNKELLFRTKEGVPFWVAVNSVPIRDKRKTKYYVSYWVDITEEKQLRENMVSYVRQISNAQEKERERIARELHDDTAQALAALYGEVDDLLQLEAKGSPKYGQLRNIENKIDVMLQNIRSFSHNLRPGLLDKLGLIPSLELLLEETSNNPSHGLRCKLAVKGIRKRLSSEVELALFRICQEALNNANKHAEATCFVITVLFLANSIHIKLSDNGIGFQAPENTSDLARAGKLGLIGMYERASLIGGTLSIKSADGKGTTISITAPLLV
jgi:two-component system sensor histidine kinase DegS